jgi:hypothetical protein
MACAASLGTATNNKIGATRVKRNVCTGDVVLGSASQPSFKKEKISEAHRPGLSAAAD